MEPQKYCPSCKQSKDFDQFGKNRNTKSGLNAYCKTCCREKRKSPNIKEAYRKARLKFRAKPGAAEIRKKHDRKYAQSEKGKATLNAYKEKNKEKLKAYHEEYSRRWAVSPAGKASLRRARKKCYYKNLERSRKLQREFYHKRKRKIEYQINDNIASGMYYSLTRGKSGLAWEKSVGYPLESLVSHLEGLFQPGMSWKNYGDWEIDHVEPKSNFSFASTDDPGFKQLWTITNLQPLWAIDNQRKGCKTNFH